MSAVIVVCGEQIHFYDHKVGISYILAVNRILIVALRQSGILQDANKLAHDGTLKTEFLMIIRNVQIAIVAETCTFNLLFRSKLSAYIIS